MKITINNISYDENKKALDLITFTAADGASLSITNYGARIINLKVRDKNSVMRDIVLANDPKKGFNDTAYMGAICGRYANRIAGGSFTLNNITYNLFKNDSDNTLHGGKVGFSDKMWDYEITDDNTVTLSLLSPDMDENFPGNLKVRVGYSFTDEHILGISYYAMSDRDTYINLTNHAYFNVNGHDSGDICGHILSINADYFIPVDEKMIPTGKVENVDDTVFDFRQPTKIGARIDKDDSQLNIAKGYDHSFILKDGNAAKLYSEQSGICLTLKTEFPALQLYTGNYIKNLQGKDGCVYSCRGGVCLEAQFLADSMHHENFPSVMLAKDTEYVYQSFYSVGLI